MRFQTKMAFTVCCIGLLATIVPASGNPLSRDQHRIIAASKPLFGWPALVAEARKYIGTNPTDRKSLWCATFINMILRETGYSGTNSDAARSFAEYGRRLSKPEVGAIAVLTRGKRGGHVGVVTGIDAHGNPIIISGNHNKRVGVAVYPRSRVIAYVMPSERRSVPAQVAARAGSSRPAENGLASPIAELLAAIGGEPDRAQARSSARESARGPALQPQQAVGQPERPVAPHRVVQQLPDQESGNRGLPLASPLAELFGAMDNARPAPPRVERRVPGRVAADTGLAGFLGLPDAR